MYDILLGKSPDLRRQIENDIKSWFMEKESMLHELSFGMVQQSDVKLLYSDDDFIFIDDFSKVPSYWGAHIGSFVIVFCLGGKITFRYNDKGECIGEHECFVFQPGSIVTDLMMSPDFQGRAVFMTQRLVQGLLQNEMSIWNKVLYVEKENKFKIDEKDEIIVCYSQYSKLMAFDEHRPLAKQIILSVIHTFLIEMCSIFLIHEQQKGIDMDTSPDDMGRQGHIIFHRFITQLQQEKQKRHPVNYYARQQNISPKYLTTAVKNESGKTVSQWITEYVNADIEYYLYVSTYTIKEISIRLGFPNMSFFGKYVKSHFGDSPRQLRKIGIKGEHAASDKEA
jgi:AraC family transcriptional activator of pobA